MFLALEMENLRSIAHMKLNFRREDGSVGKWTLLLAENGTVRVEWALQL